MSFRGRHGSIAVVTAALVAFQSCAVYRWNVVPLTEVDTSEQRMWRRLARFETAEGVVRLEVERIAPPYVAGRALSGGPVQVDLRRTRSIELWPAAGELGQERRKILPTQGALAATPLAGRTVRLQQDSGAVRLVVERVEWPWVHGQFNDGSGTVFLDLRRVTDVQVREPDVVATVGKSVLGVAGVLALLALIVALTKESCPIVYVDRGAGWELVGEAYAGAAFRSIQRDDLLPLAPLESRSSVRVRLRNEARETQYTDRAELVVVDHPPDARVLSTFDGRLVAAGPGTPAAHAGDLRGHDLTALVAAEDGQAWQADLVEAASAPHLPLHETVVAEFASAPRAALLEIVGGNTDWLDVTFGRFFAAMGDRLAGYLADGNAPEAGPRIRRWREREGVDLAVDVWREGSWRRVAVVPTIGPVAMRRVAIPVATEGGPLRVRLSGGLGFWRFDQLALAEERTARHTVSVVSPAAARGAAGVDRRAVLVATDGAYDALTAPGDTLDLEFALPPRAPGARRFAFLSINGYYNVHPPLQRRWLPGTLRAVREQPGALARLALDLARAYGETMAPAGAAE